MEIIFEPVASTTLFWVQDLQRIEVALQNKLAKDPGAVLENLTRTMQTTLVDYNTFVNFKKLTNILICLWKRANQKHFDRVSLEFTTQLIENQFKAVIWMEPGRIRNKLSRVIMRCLELKSNGHRMHPVVNVMDRIEDAFSKLDMIKGSRKNNIVKIIVKGSLMTRMINHNRESRRGVNFWHEQHCASIRRYGTCTVRLNDFSICPCSNFQVHTTKTARPSSSIRPTICYGGQGEQGSHTVSSPFP